VKQGEINMAKKIVVGIVGAALLGVFLFGTRFFGYVGTVVENARQSAQENVPFELELAELQKLVDGYDKDIAALNKDIVRLEVEIENLDEQIAQKESTLKQQESEMLTLLDTLGDGNTELVSVGGKDYTSAEVRADLVRREKKYDTAASELTKKKSTRESQAKHLQTLNDRKETMKAEKAQYEADIAELAATKSALEAQETVENVDEFDNTRREKARELKEKLSKRLRMDEKMMEKRLESAETNIPVNVEGDAEVNVQDRLREKLKNSDAKKAGHDLISIER
jgi:chromosome segregation ATPase